MKLNAQKMYSFSEKASVATAILRFILMGLKFFAPLPWWSGDSRFPKGSQTRMGLASLFGTWMAQGLNPLHQCLALLTVPTHLMGDASCKDSLR